MATYQAVVTNAGRTLFSQAATGGGQVLPVRITTGDGTLGSADPTTLSALIHQVQDYSISSSNALVPYQSTYQFLIDSSQVIATYQLREIGLIAKLGTTGTETLIYYSYTTGTPDTISPSSGYNATIDFNTLTITFSNTPNTSATLTAVVPPALHAITHLQRTDGSSTDPLPIVNTTDVGLVPRTPNDPSKVLIGTATAAWASVPRIVGEIIDYAGATPPLGWLLCDGNAYPTAGYPALFAVIGYAYGGSGANFCVPDLRGRSSIGAGQGPGLSPRALAGKGGEETHQLLIAELPAHNHGVNDPWHAHNVYDPGHSHGLTQSPHAHGVYDPGHNHAIGDPGHAHGVADPGHAHSIVNCTGEGLNLPSGFGISIYNPRGAINTSTNATGIGIYGAATNISLGISATGIGIYAQNANISVNGSGTGIGIYGSPTNISIQNTGSYTPHNVMQPFIVLNKLIRAV